MVLFNLLLITGTKSVAHLMEYLTAGEINLSDDELEAYCNISKLFY
jgi:aryl-alcohol dehydrogenase-like predicted oxidoreductase